MRAWGMWRPTRNESLIAASLLALALPALAGIAIEDKPASLVSSALVMHRGRPFLRLADLARSLGGSGNYQPAGHRYDIQVGGGGVLVLNPGGVAAAGFGPDLRGPGRGRPARQNALALGLGGQDVLVGDEEFVLLRPDDPAVSLDVLARLLGGRPRFDQARGLWFLPPGNRASPLRFR